MPIDTHLDANPADITASAAAVEKIKASVDKSEDDLIGARKNLAELEGATAVSSVGSINSSVKSCEGLVSGLGNYKTALTEFASALSNIKADVEGGRSEASGGGLTVSGESVLDPTGMITEYACVAVDEQKKNLYKSLDKKTSEIRDRETEARRNFADACAEVAAADLPAPIRTVTNPVVDYVLPSAGSDGISTVGNAFTWGVNRVDDASKLLKGYGLRAGEAFSLKGVHALTAPNNVFGSIFAKTRDVIDMRSLDNWLPSRAIEEGSKGAKALNGAKWLESGLNVAGKVATGVSFGVSAYEQWQKDSHNPSIGDGEKVTRAVTKGGVTAAGGWAGAQAGAIIGGSVGGPVGVAVGGIIGGIVGSGLGEMAADGLNNLFHGLFH